HAVEQRIHRVLGGAGGAPQGGEGLGHPPVVPPALHGLEPDDLRVGRRVVDIQNWHRRFIFVDKAVHPDDDLVLGLDCLLNRYADSAISRCGKPCSIAATMPPMRSIVSKYCCAPSSMSRVSFSTKYEPPSGSTMFVTPLSYAMTCCVRSARVAASAV